MKLSVIIPNHNNSKTVLKTIKSISPFSKNEIIVVDDNSGDNSVELVKKSFPKLKTIILKENKGASRARNEGIKSSKGDMLLFIDSDAWLKEGSLRQMISLMDKNIDIVFPKLIFEDGRLFYPVLDIEKRYPHISCCFLIKKVSLGKLDELFDENYETYLEDYDFFIRCKLAGLKAKYCDEAVVIHANKEAKDYSRRYYFEVRNILYGIRKLGRQAKKSGIYNPFTLTALTKAFYCGIINFAWFNWQGHPRNTKNNKILSLMVGKNSITHNRLTLIPIFLKAVLDSKKIIEINFSKIEKIRKFYN